MDCLECGGSYTKKSGTYSLVDPYVGRILIQGVVYYQCDRCEDILYTPEMAQAIESQRNGRIQEFLDRFPIGDFVGAAETASILGISRQALHKNRRIKRGFIYQTRFAGTTVYLRDSVTRFQRTGDGRFALQSNRYTPYTAYSKTASAFVDLASYEPSRPVYQIPTGRITPSLRPSFISRKEYSHAS